MTVFNPSTGRWREMPPLPFATFAPGAGVYRGRLFLFGGMNRMSRYQDTIYALNLCQPGDWYNTGRYLRQDKGFPIVVDYPLGGLGILGGHSYILSPDGWIDTPVAGFEHLK